MAVSNERAKVVKYGYSANQFLARMAGLPTSRGAWFATNSRPALSIEFSRTASASVSSVCGFVIDATVTVRTDDGAIDVTGPVRIRVSEYVATFELSLPALPSTKVGPPVWPDDVKHVKGNLSVASAGSTSPSPSPSLRAELELSGLDRIPWSAVVVQENALIGAWSTNDLGVTGPPNSYTPPAELASVCVGAKQFQAPLASQSDGGTAPPREYAKFPDEAAALAAEVGTWVRCLDNTAVERAGVQVLPDGGFRELAFEGRGLVALHGFEHEGVLRLLDAFDQVGVPNTYDVRFGPLVTLQAFASSLALVATSETPDMPDAVYLPTTLPVQDEAPTYADGERAGTAGCASVEQGIVAAEDTLAALSGTFVLCNGALSGGVSRLRFANGTVDLLDAGGALIKTWPYREDGMNYSPLGLTLGDPQGEFIQWGVIASRFPRKLRITASSRPWIVVQVAVFSAMP